MLQYFYPVAIQIPLFKLSLGEIIVQLSIIIFNSMERLKTDAAQQNLCFPHQKKSKHNQAQVTKQLLFKEMEVSRWHWCK